MRREAGCSGSHQSFIVSGHFSEGELVIMKGSLLEVGPSAQSLAGYRGYCIVASEVVSGAVQGTA